MMIRGRTIAAGTLLLLMGSCSEDDPPSADGIGPEGGTLVLPDGAQIELPPGAVPAGVEVTAQVVEGATAPPNGMRVRGKVYAFTPHGTRFAKPATIKIPALRTANSVYVLDDDEDTSWERVAGTRAQSGFHVMAVEHISLFAELEASGGGGGTGGDGGGTSGGSGGVGGAISEGGEAGGGIPTGVCGAGGAISEGGETAGGAGLGGAGAGPGGAGGRDGGADVPLVAGRMCAGFSHGCSIIDDGKIVCWGAGSSGQLGDGIFYDASPWGRPTARLVPNITNAVQLSCAMGSVSALLADGTVVGWGAGSSGQFGDGTQTARSAVPRPSSLTHVKQVSASGQHVCALLETGTVSCWGSDSYGQLGGGGAVPGSTVSTPQNVPGLSGVLEVAAGVGRTCAVLADRTVKCWGNNEVGQLGVASPATSSTPLAVPGLTDVVHLSLGWYSSCAVLGSGAISCWGRGDSGQLGDGVAYPLGYSTSTPVSVVGATDSRWVSATLAHSCLVDDSSRVRCWGSGSSGQLGDGSFHAAPPYGALSPAAAVLTDVEDLTTGTDTTCARLGDQSLWCWGYGVYGALGSGVQYPEPPSGPLEPPLPPDQLGSSVPVRVVITP